MPLLGINLGKVGFLSKAEADQLEPVLEHLQAGAYVIRERMGLHGLDPARRPAGRHGGSPRSTTSSWPGRRWRGSSGSR